MIRLAILAFLVASTASAQHSHTHTAEEKTLIAPLEPGQEAFAAIAEIVTILRADPDTDWNQVDIGALHQHLLDMDDLVKLAEVTSWDIPNGARFKIKTTGPGGGAVQRMVPAHAPVLAGETGWSSQVEIGGDEVTWTVTSPENPKAIRALGFIGLMAIGGHHQNHHLGMASGQLVH
jgi:hypothetical protein